jgi:hypothetical protein
MKNNVSISWQGQKVNINIQGDYAKPVYTLRLARSKREKKIIKATDKNGMEYWAEKGRRIIPLAKELSELINMALFQHPFFWGI